MPDFVFGPGQCFADGGGKQVANGFVFGCLLFVVGEYFGFHFIEVSSGEFKLSLPMLFGRTELLVTAKL